MTLGGTCRKPCRRRTRVISLTALCTLMCVMHACRARAVQESGQDTDCMMQWLLSLGIAEEMATSYHNQFCSQFIDQRTLREMCRDDLNALGVSALGHRVLINSAAKKGTHDTCRSGGSCNYIEGAYICSCPPGFTGDHCQFATNGCQDSPCQNGGTCVENEDGTIRCDCPPTYYGALCQHCTYSDLSESVNKLSQEVEKLKENSRDSILKVADSVRRSTGLRFFKEWLELNLLEIVQIRYFIIAPRCFLGLVTTNSREVHHGLVIYEIVDSERLVHIQTIMNVTISSFKPFSLQGQHYIAVGQYYDSSLGNTPPRVNSELYRWNGTKFILSSPPYANNNLRTMGIKDVDFITLPDDNSFLALAAHDNYTSYNVPTYIYRHHPDMGTNFYHYSPNLKTTGAMRVNFFTFNSTTYLFVAEEYSATGERHTSSSIYRWNSAQFVLHQEIPTDTASDLLPFSVGDNFFVVAVNNRRSSAHNIESIVYIFCNGLFVEYDSLETKGATKAEFFLIGLDAFLIFSNSHDDTNRSASTASTIYRIEGAKFIRFQEILTHNAVYVHVFELHNGCPVLAIANKAGKSRLYKWNSLSFINDQY